MKALVALLMVAGCTTVPGAVTVETITLQDIYLAALIAGVDTAKFTEPASMSLREKRIIAGVCLAANKVNTQFDEQSEAICNPLMAEFASPALAEPPDVVD